MTFDYELCKKRDDGWAKGKTNGRDIEVLGPENRIISESISWFPCRVANGNYYVAIPETELSNLDPPQPELPKMDVVWWRTSSGDVVRSMSIPEEPIGAVDELRRITVDPNVLTADELAGFNVFVSEDTKSGELQGWRFYKIATFTSDLFSTHAIACRAATDWLREQGKVK